MYNRQRDRRMVVSTTRRNDEIEIISRVGVECINSERKKKRYEDNDERKRPDPSRYEQMMMISILCARDSEHANAHSYSRRGPLQIPFRLKIELERGMSMCHYTIIIGGRLDNR